MSPMLWNVWMIATSVFTTGVLFVGTWLAFHESQKSYPPRLDKAPTRVENDSEKSEGGPTPRRPTSPNCESSDDDGEPKEQHCVTAVRGGS